MIQPRKHCLLNYDTQQWCFARVLSRDLFKVGQLHRLHEFVQQKKQRLGLSLQLTAEDNLAMRQLMQNLPQESTFYQMYHAFMVKVIKPVAGYPLSYSKHPKMRVHFPGTPSVSSFHTDVAVTQRVDQVNLWIPFTDVEDTATLWVESDYGLADYAPIPVKYGQVLIFDGGYLMHGTKANTTDVTRVSLDLRFSIQRASTRLDGLKLLDQMISQVEGMPAVNFALRTGGTN
jgi:hypothetical protein